jgi:hypothetical protein
MTDLKPFCGTDQYRDYISRPFSRDSFSYATDGIIAVRVERREDVPDQADRNKPDITKLPWDKATDFVPLPAFSLPASGVHTIECAECYDGKEHDCPDCDCDCEACDGTGQLTVSDDDERSIDLLGIPFAVCHVRKLVTLPNVQIAKIDGLLPWSGRETILAFKFDGGDGLFMPLHERRKEHIAGSATGGEA